MKRIATIFSAVIIGIFLLGTHDSQAQVDAKFGKVSKEDLETTLYDKDTSAAAVVLYDKGTLNGRTLDFTRHYRIKILKKSGLDWANKVVEIPSKSSVSGYTYNLVDGEVEKTKLGRESIYQEEIVEDLFILNIFMPNVKVGSIVEIKYTHFLPPFEWKFQEEIPVAYSELELEPNTYITFSKNMMGYESIRPVGQDHWVATNMPAMKAEPFTNNIENYLTKMQMEITNINIPGVVYRDYASDWLQVFKTLYNSTRFGDELNRTGFMKSEAKEIMEKYSSDEERLQAAYKFVQDNIKWNEKKSLYASGDLPITFNKDKIGNSADVNLSLIALLRKMDYDVKTIVLSTVDHGVLSFAVPSINKLNYVVGYLVLNDKEYFLDATDPNLPLGMLPNRCLNGNARLMDVDVNKWINLTPTDKIHKEAVQAEFSLDEMGSITGKIQCERSDYAALEFRNKLKENSNQDDYIENLEIKYNGLQIENYSLNNLNENLKEAVQEEFEVDITDMADDLGTTIAFTPIFFNESHENPFKLQNRLYPVFFSQPISKTSVVRISLPEGYSFMDLPAPVNVALPDDAGKFMYSASKVNEGEVQIFYRLDIKKTIFLPDTYPYLQKLHSIIVEAVSKQILIKSKT